MISVFGSMVVALFCSSFTYIVFFSPETCLSMDTSSGSPTLDVPLMSTLSCGNFSSSTGYFHIFSVCVGTTVFMSRISN